MIRNNPGVRKRSVRYERGIPTFLSKIVKEFCSFPWDKKFIQLDIFISYVRIICDYIKSGTL